MKQYHTATNLGWLQPNMTWCHRNRGPGYHWIPGLYSKMGLPVLDGIQEMVCSLLNDFLRGANQGKIHSSFLVSLKRLSMSPAHYNKYMLLHYCHYWYVCFYYQPCKYYHYYPATVTLAEAKVTSIQSISCLRRNRDFLLILSNHKILAYNLYLYLFFSGRDISQIARFSIHMLRMIWLKKKQYYWPNLS